MCQKVVHRTGIPILKNLCARKRTKISHGAKSFRSVWRQLMSFSKYLSALLIIVLCAAATQAGGGRRQRWQPSYEPSWNYASPEGERTTRVSQYAPVEADVSKPSADASRPSADSASGEDALAEVNAVRAQRGLHPYQHDPLLHQAARAAAKQRAARLISGHLPESDFSYVPSGGSATAAGCAAWTPDWGWGACCTYDNYTYAGASWVMGQDGRRYMHLFVR